MKHGTITERFPLTLTLLAFWGVAFLTLPFWGLSVDTTPIISAKAQIAFTMFLGGIVLLFLTSIIYTRGFGLISPSENLARPFTTGQAIVVAVGFILVSIWQVYVNQATIIQTLAPASTLTVTSNTALLFSIDVAIAEESLFGAITILLYLTLVYFNLPRLTSAAITLPLVGAAFAWFHIYVYGTTPAALWFVFGARMVLSGVMLATTIYSRHLNRLRSASLAAPVFIHTVWNGLTF